ncbi:MAG: hypothetical protein MK185_04665 [Saccharospirillaceae bacterium]|nr:hypothetical protein [Saccharospirillaceae bacterium]
MSDSVIPTVEDFKQAKTDLGVINQVVNSGEAKDVELGNGKKLPTLKKTLDRLTAHNPFRNRGSWLSGATYAVNDIWKSSDSVWYVALEEYLAGANEYADIESGKVQVHQVNIRSDVSSDVASLATRNPDQPGETVRLNGHSRAGSGSGDFIAMYGDYSEWVSADPLRGVYVPFPSDNSGKDGAWVRDLSSLNFLIPTMFGQHIGDQDSSSEVEACMKLCSKLGFEFRWIAGVTYCKDVVYPGNLTISGFGKALSRVYAASGDSVYGAILVSDRFSYSVQSLGRRVAMREFAIDGRQDDGIEINGVISCNYRPEFTEMHFRELNGVGILAPGKLHDGTIVNFNAVGMRIKDCRFREMKSALKTENDAYSDGWFLNCSMNGFSEYAIDLYSVSGWFISHNHPDTMQKGFVSGKTGSALCIHDNYNESFDKANMAWPLFMLEGLRGSGISIHNNRGFNSLSRNDGRLVWMSVKSAIGELNVRLNIHDNIIDVRNKNDAVEFVPLLVSSGSGSVFNVNHHNNQANSVNKPIEKSGAGVINYNANYNSWQYVSSPESSEFNQYIPVGYKLYNDNSNSNISGWVCVDSGNSASAAKWSAEYRGISRQDFDSDLDIGFDVYVNPISKHAFGVDINSARFNDQERLAHASYKIYIHSGSNSSEPPVMYIDNIVSPIGFDADPSFELVEKGVVGIYTLRVVAKSLSGDAKFGVTIK